MAKSSIQKEMMAKEWSDVGSRLANRTLTNMTEFSDRVAWNVVL